MMTQIYSDPSRENDPHALPNIEVFWIGSEEAREFMTEQFDNPTGNPSEYVGWYWWACFPGCLPDSEACGPFDTEAAAIADAQSD